MTSGNGITGTIFVVLLAIGLFAVLFGAFLLVPLLVVIFGFFALLVGQRSSSRGKSDLPGPREEKDLTVPTGSRRGTPPDPDPPNRNG